MTILNLFKPKQDNAQSNLHELISYIENTFSDNHTSPEPIDCLIPDENIQELQQIILKYIHFYSVLITLVSRNKNGGELIITLNYWLNNEVQNLSSLLITGETEQKDIHILLSYQIKKTQFTLKLVFDLMDNIEKQGVFYFKDEKQFIIDFLEYRQ